MLQKVNAVKIAVVYNRNSRNVINLFGMPNREKIGMQTIKRLTDALRSGGHQVIALEGDKDLIDRLEEFMPRVVRGERPGLVFNVSYGIQGQARYTHVPGILEMVGIPYVASGPLAHSLALDKVVTKMILRQHRLPTPDFAVLQTPDMPLDAGLTYPMIVKPKNEAVSFGLKVVQNEGELRDAASVIFKEFGQAVLAEQFIEGREINVGLLGNNPPEAFPPVELDFGKEGPAIYTYEDKIHKSGREVKPICPAPIGEALTREAQDIAKRAFTALGIYDCARVDMRYDGKQLHVLEVNSLPSLGEHGSYLVGAAQVGLDFTKFVNRLVEVASARYFGTPAPTQIDVSKADARSHVFSYITARRDQLEKRLREWVAESSRTSDPVGLRQAVVRAGDLFQELGMKPVAELTDQPEVSTWETAQGLAGGTLLVAHLDVPMDVNVAAPVFRRDPEWLYGEGIGSRAPLVSLEVALRSLRSIRRLRRLSLGVVLYTDEGYGARYSAEMICKASARAKRVLVLRPGNLGDKVITQRRGERVYRFQADGEALRIGRPTKKTDVVRWAWTKLEECARLSAQKQRVSVSTTSFRTEALPMRLPHRVVAKIVVTFPDERQADDIEGKLRTLFGKKGPRWELELYSDRPPMPERRGTIRLVKELEQLAAEWSIPVKRESSVWPSVAGLVPAKTACLCGVGPVARDLRTPSEAVQRISLVQRTLLLAQFLAKQLGT